MNDKIFCPHCGSNSDNIVKNGWMRSQGKKVQRYKCKYCNCTFSLNVFRNKDFRTKLLAVLLKHSEYDINSLANFFGVSSTAIRQWETEYLREIAFDESPMFYRQHIHENTKPVKATDILHYLNSNNFNRQHKGIFIALDEKKHICNIKIFE